MIIKYKTKQFLFVTDHFVSVTFWAWGRFNVELGMFKKDGE
jgi:hypothetical protein